MLFGYLSLFGHYLGKGKKKREANASLSMTYELSPTTHGSCDLWKSYYA